MSGAEWGFLIGMSLGLACGYGYGRLRTQERMVKERAMVVLSALLERRRAVVPLDDEAITRVLTGPTYEDKEAA